MFLLQLLLAFVGLVDGLEGTQNGTKRRQRDYVIVYRVCAVCVFCVICAGIFFICAVCFVCDICVIRSILMYFNSTVPSKRFVSFVPTRFELMSIMPFVSFVSSHFEMRWHILHVNVCVSGFLLFRRGRINNDSVVFKVCT